MFKQYAFHRVFGFFLLDTLNMYIYIYIYIYLHIYIVIYTSFFMVDAGDTWDHIPNPRPTSGHRSANAVVGHSKPPKWPKISMESHGSQMKVKIHQ